MDAEVTCRRLDAGLLLAMLIVPGLAVWLFLRRGYGRDLRLAAFGYAGTMAAVALIAAWA